jgi:hypothetical protein
LWKKIKDFFGECLVIFFLGVIKSSKSINYLTYIHGSKLPLSFKWSNTRCPPTTLKKFYECALHPWMLMMWTCKILFQGKTWGKTKKKGDNFGNFIRLFELLLICETTSRRCLGHKICKGGISNHNVHKHLNPIFGE